MPQRINASRVFFSMNMRSVPEPPRPQNRESNHMSLRTISPPESHHAQQANFHPISPPSNRRMSRRVSNKTIMPRAISRPQTIKTPIQELAGNLEVIDTQPLNELILSDQAAVNREDYNSTALINPVYTPPLSKSETEDHYSIDRPVYLLSQKYFGTRY